MTVIDGDDVDGSPDQFAPHIKHTDEPSVDELLKLCCSIVDEYDKDDAEREALGYRPRKLDQTQTIVITLARALRSRLSHPTLSADRNAVIEECAEMVDCGGCKGIARLKDGSCVRACSSDCYQMLAAEIRALKDTT